MNTSSFDSITIQQKKNLILNILSVFTRFINSAHPNNVWRIYESEVMIEFFHIKDKKNNIIFIISNIGKITVYISGKCMMDAFEFAKDKICIDACAKAFLNEMFNVEIFSNGVDLLQFVAPQQEHLGIIPTAVFI
jgi:hypothetical protein